MGTMSDSARFELGPLIPRSRLGVICRGSGLLDLDPSSLPGHCRLTNPTGVGRERVSSKYFRMELIILNL